MILNSYVVAKCFLSYIAKFCQKLWGNQIDVRFTSLLFSDKFIYIFWLSLQWLTCCLVCMCTGSNTMQYLFFLKGINLCSRYIYLQCIKCMKITITLKAIFNPNIYCCFYAIICHVTDIVINENLKYICILLDFF